MSALTDGLNPEQARAVTTTDGPLLILAGAGSGKTRVLTRRVAYLIAQGVHPWRILAVTFTNKAAAEMKERVSHLVGPDGDQVWMSTFHSTCVRILRRDIDALGYDRSFAIWDDEDQVRALKRVMIDLKIDPKVWPPNGFRARIDRAKNALKGPDDVEVRPGDKLPAVFRAYDERLKAANALDFNDIINKVVQLFRDHPDRRKGWQDRFRYVMVDEYQDTNKAQYELLRLLVDREDRRNLAVVGDDDQSIYSFRGADIRNILDFEKDFPDAAVVKLEQNYRSTANILAAASAVVHHNENRKDKTLRTDADAGDKLQFLSSEDEEGEADTVLREIRALLRTRKPQDIALIYRTNAQSRPFERALTDARLPHVLVGGRKFYERREVRDLLAYLKLLLNPADDMSFLRIVNTPTRGIGDTALDTLTAEARAAGVPLLAAAQRMSLLGGRAGGKFLSFCALIRELKEASGRMEPGAFVQYLARQTGYLTELERENTDEARDRIRNIEELASAVAGAEGEGPEERLLAFVDKAALAGQADELPDPEGGSITLLTAHLAKGLEFPVVFVVGMNEGTFPLSRNEREDDLEEERRLVYVAITRARERLYFSTCRRRFVTGENGRYAREVGPSPFLAEIPRALFERAPPGRLGLDAPTRRPAAAPIRDPALARPPGLGGWSSRPPPARPQGSFGAPPSRPVMTRAAPPTDRRRMRPESPGAFRVGVDVFHPMWGVGTVTTCEGTGGGLKLTVQFRDHGSKTVFAVSAGMDILLP